MENNNNSNKNDVHQNNDNKPSTSNFSDELETEKNNLDAEKFAQKQEQYKQIIQSPEQVNINFQNPYIWRIGFSRRLGAYIIDYIFLMLLFVIMAVITGLSEKMLDIVGNDFSIFTNMEKMNELTLIMNNNITPLMLAVTFIYYSLEVIFAQSLGKILLGMQIGSADKKNASYPRLLSRFALKFGNSILTLLFIVTSLDFIATISSMWSFIFFVGCFFALSAKKQALHDMIAGTSVYFKDELQQLNLNETVK
jgi:uncharacterized RDD family membrane protein YckC